MKLSTFFVAEKAPTGDRWYMMCYDNHHLTKAIWSIHATKAEAEASAELAKQGNHPIQIEERTLGK